MCTHYWVWFPSLLGGLILVVKPGRCNACFLHRRLINFSTVIIRRRIRLLVIFLLGEGILIRVLGEDLIRWWGASSRTLDEWFHCCLLGWIQAWWGLLKGRWRALYRSFIFWQTSHKEVLWCWRKVWFMSLCFRVGSVQRDIMIFSSLCLMFIHARVHPGHLGSALAFFTLL